MLKKFFFGYKFTLLCVLYFCSISIMMFQGRGFGYLCFLSIPGILSIILIMCILAKTRYTLLLTITLSFLIAFDAFFAYVFHNSLFIGAMGSIFETNMREALGTLKLVFLPGISLWAFSLFLVIMSQRELKKINISRKKLVITLLLYLGLVLPMSLTLVIVGVEENRADFKANPFMGIQKVSNLHLPFIYNDFIAIAAYRYEMYKFKKYGNTQRILPEGIVLDSKKETPDKIFLILGESSWRRHYSLYGYPVSTTPFLDSLDQAKNIDLKYYNAISPGPITREAIRMVLSYSTPFDMESLFKEKNIIEMANDAGYETVWISNQDKLGLYEGYIGFISSSAKDSSFPEPHDSYESYDKRHDFDLIPIIEAKHKSDKKQLFIIHLIGEHIPYNMSDKIDEQAIPGNKLTPELKYDRSIHNTDRMLKKIYDIANKEKSSLMIYFSDHGEVIGLGHGLMGKGSPQFEIPYITVNKSSTPVDAIISQYIDKETLLLNSSNTIYIMAHILGYSVPEKYIEKAVLEGKSIFHIDGKAHLFKDIQKEDKAN